MIKKIYEMCDYFETSTDKEKNDMKTELKEWEELYESTHGVSPWLTEAEYDDMPDDHKKKYDEVKDYYYEFDCGELMSVRVHYVYESAYYGDGIRGYRAYPVTVIAGDCEGLYFAACDVEAGLDDWFEGGEVPDDFAEFLVEIAETEEVRAMTKELWEYCAYSTVDMPRWDYIHREIDYAVTMYAVDLYYAGNR
jgi:hypothetical protein